jgi:hypothetical protein
MAQLDAARGMLDEDGRTNVRDSVVEIVDDLHDHIDRPATHVAAPDDNDKPLAHISKAENAPAEEELIAPESWRSKGAVVCLPGNGALDEALAHVIAHLAERRGFGVRTERAGALSMSQIFGLDIQGTRLICVCYLEDITPAQLRYALRRLRRKAPDAHILISLMGETANFDEEEVLAGTGNLRFVKASLDDTVDAIAAIARENQVAAEAAEKPVLSASSV